MSATNRPELKWLPKTKKPARVPSRSVKELLSARRDLIDCPSSLVL